MIHFIWHEVCAMSVIYFFSCHSFFGQFMTAHTILTLVYTILKWKQVYGFMSAFDYDVDLKWHILELFSRLFDYNDTTCDSSYEDLDHRKYDN